MQNKNLPIYIILVLVAITGLIHLIRLIFDIPIVYGGTYLPGATGGISFIIAAALLLWAYKGIREGEIKKAPIIIMLVLLGFFAFAQFTQLMFEVPLFVGDYLMPRWTAVLGFIVSVGLIIWTITAMTYQDKQQAAP